MTMEEFLTSLRTAAKDLTEKDIRGELSGLIDENEIAGLDLRIRRTVFDLVGPLESKGV
jgi:hypothetical protein